MRQRNAAATVGRSDLAKAAAARYGFLILEQGFARLGITPPAPAGIADCDTAIVLAELGIGHAILPALPRLTDPAEPSSRRPIPALDPSPSAGPPRQWNVLSLLATEFELLAAQE